MTLAGSLLWVNGITASDARASEAASNPIVLINEYLGPVLKIVPTTRRMCSNRTRHEKSGFQLNEIGCLNDTYFYVTRDGIHGESTKFLDLQNLTLQKELMYSQSKSDEYFRVMRKIQKESTEPAQQTFGSTIVPDDADASFFPKTGSLVGEGTVVIADRKNIVAYDTVHAAREEIYNLLDEAINAKAIVADAAPHQRMRKRQLRNALLVGTAGLDLPAKKAAQ